MLQQKFFKNLKTLLLQVLPISVLYGCSIFSPPTPAVPEPKIIVETKIVEKNIPIQARPKGLRLNKDLVWYVITPDTLPAFSERLQNEQGTFWVFYALEVKDYEKLALNVAEIKRYILQQQGLIEYYENSITDNQTTMESK